jgi:hypothetical protein
LQVLLSVAPSSLATSRKAHDALRRMVIDLENLDATILQFDSNFKVESIAPKAFRPPKDWSNRGEMTRIAALNAGLPYRIRKIIVDARRSPPSASQLPF